MNFEYYVLNESLYRNKEIQPFNVFSNCLVNECTEKEVRRYLRNPNKYKRKYGDDKDLIGFPAFVKELTSIIRWQEKSRCEYEITVGSAFITEICDVIRDIDNYKTREELVETLEKENKRNGRLKKIDCFMQCEPNMEMIAREVIYQAKQQLKEQKT